MAWTMVSKEAEMLYEVALEEAAAVAELEWLGDDWRWKAGTRVSKPSLFQDLLDFVK